jgi:hypothetical protein
MVIKAIKNKVNSITWGSIVQVVILCRDENIIMEGIVL